MVNILALIFSLSAFGAVVPSGVPQIGLGSHVQSPTTPQSFISPANLAGTGKIFHLIGGSIAALVNGDFYPFFKDGVAYQVTAGKSAFCFDWQASSNAAISTFQLVSDTVAITFAQAGALTAGVFQCGVTTRYCAVSGTSTSNLPLAQNFSYVFARFPCLFYRKYG